MQTLISGLCSVALLSTIATLSVPANAQQSQDNGSAATQQKNAKPGRNSRYRPVSLGVRPYYLVEDMDPGPLKDRLQRCADTRQNFYKRDFSIAHRGAALQFPEHTEESYRMAARQGAGIVECDVTFTKDRELVCRHSQCDLHTTTNILATPLASKCSVPFSPATDDAPASARCCTSDITLAEFKTLKGKMDASDSSATTVDEYLGGTADWRTDLYTQNGTLLSHKESIALFRELGVKFTPELKSASVEMPFEGTYTQEAYATQMIRDYQQAGVSPRLVWAQSFNLDDVKHWIRNTPSFGRQAVYLDSRPYSDPSFVSSLADFESIHASGVEIIAPPMWVLLTTNSAGRIVPSDYAVQARQAGLDIITWTLERAGPLAGGGGWYHQTITDAINNDGDTFTVLDVLARQVKVIGVFSDWPATTTFYANCIGGIR